MSQNILFIFNLGSEVRQFYYSNVIKNLIQDNHNIYISLRVNNNKTKSIFSKEVNIVDYFNFSMPFYYNLIKEIIDSTENQSSSWNYLKSEKKFKNKINKYLYLFIFKLLKTLVKISIFKKLIIRIQNKLFDNVHFDELESLLHKFNINKIIVNVPNTSIPLLSVAKQLNIPINLIFHTNKDIFTLGKISFPYNKIGVWNKKMKKDLLLGNLHFNENQVEVVGCSHFSYLADRNTSKNVTFLKNFDIDNTEKILLYIAAAPFVVKNEHEYLLLLENSLKQLNIRNYKIIVKTNPMDETEYWQNFKSKTIIIYKSDWEWNTKEAFNYPKYDELKLFSKVLQKADLCLGLPSTVAIESAIMKTPNLNLCFEYRTAKSIYNNIIDMWNAPFYETTREYGSIPIFNENELVYHLDLFLLRQQNMISLQEKYLKEEITYNVNSMTDKTVNFIIR